jgi:hypothetical protein
MKWNFEAESDQQAAEQGAAPDRLQLHSLRSFLTSLIPLPAAGELVVGPMRAVWLRAKENDIISARGVL